MNQSSPLDSWSILSADIDYEHLAHRLEPQCYRPLIYRLALVPSPICITDNWPSPPVEAAGDYENNSGWMAVMKRPIAGTSSASAALAQWHHHSLPGRRRIVPLLSRKTI